MKYSASEKKNGKSTIDITIIQSAIGGIWLVCGIQDTKCYIFYLIDIYVKRVVSALLLNEWECCATRQS